MATAALMGMSRLPPLLTVPLDFEGFSAKPLTVINRRHTLRAALR